MSKIFLLSGRTFDILNPEESTFVIEDIAHALANACRFGGHVRYFYSVAQHSVLVSKLVPQELALDGLLHDATEAFLGDLIRPLKKIMVDYQELERKVHLCIAKRYGIANVVPDAVEEADNIALMAEARDLCSLALYQAVFEFREGVPGTITPSTPTKAKRDFMRRFANLTGRKL